MIFQILMLLISIAADCKSRNNLENRMEVICKNLDYEIVMEAFFKTIENKEEIASVILEDFSISDFNLACLACLNVSNIESLKIFSNFSHFEEASENVAIPYFDRIHLSRTHVKVAGQLLASSSFKISNNGKIILSHLTGELELKSNSFVSVRAQNLSELEISHSRVKISDENTFTVLNEMKKLTLRNIGIERIPKIGAKLEVLDLFDNKISKLEEKSLDGSYNLQDLNLRRNQIFQIDNDFFSRYDASSLTTVDLSDNNLLSLDPESFRNIEKKQNIRIIAYGNKFDCETCEMHDLQNLLNSHELKIDLNINCHLPKSPTPFLELNLSDKKCHNSALMCDDDDVEVECKKFWTVVLTAILTLLVTFAALWATKLAWSKMNKHQQLPSLVLDVDDGFIDD